MFVNNLIIQVSGKFFTYPHTLNFPQCCISERTP